MKCIIDDCSGKRTNTRPVKIKREQAGWWGISTVLHCDKCGNFSAFFGVGIEAKGTQIRGIVENWIDKNGLIQWIE